MRHRIDQETADRIRKAWVVCSARGTDPVMMLDVAKVLRHAGTIKGDRLQMMSDIISAVESMDAERWRPAMPKTPLDMKQAVLAFLKGVKESVEKNQ